MIFRFNIIETEVLDMDKDHDYVNNSAFKRGSIALLIKIQSVNQMYSIIKFH